MQYVIPPLCHKGHRGAQCHSCNPSNAYALECGSWLQCCIHLQTWHLLKMKTALSSLLESWVAVCYHELGPSCRVLFPCLDPLQLNVETIDEVIIMLLKKDFGRNKLKIISMPLAPLPDRAATLGLFCAPPCVTRSINPMSRFRCSIVTLSMKQGTVSVGSSCKHS